MSKTERNIRRGIFLSVRALLLILLCGAVRPRCEPVTESYFVKPGDTLWRIATEFLKDGNRYVEIMKLNNLDSPDIGVGQRLNLPKP